MDESANLVDKGAGGNNIHESTTASTIDNPAGTTSTMPATAMAVAPVQLQQRRRHFFFRTTSSMGTDAGGSWGGTGTDTTPRFSSMMGSDDLGYSGQLRQLAWALLVNAGLAVLLLGAVEAVVLPVLVASLELTPSPRATQLLTALLTAHLFHAGARGALLLLLAVGGSALGLALMGAWDGGFVPLFLACYVGLHTLGATIGGSGGAGALPSSASGSTLVGGPLKTLSETASARWSPVGRWRLWGA